VLRVLGVLGVLWHANLLLGDPSLATCRQVKHHMGVRHRAV